MLEADMDESGIQDGAHICVVGGYWGSENNGGDLNDAGGKY
jgi:hypothetical protein